MTSFPHLYYIDPVWIKASSEYLKRLSICHEPSAPDASKMQAFNFHIFI